MTSYYSFEHDWKEMADSAALERRIEGETDAAFDRIRPRYADDAYLSGYLEAISRLPLAASGEIIWEQAAQVNSSLEEF